MLKGEVFVVCGKHLMPQTMNANTHIPPLISFRIFGKIEGAVPYVFLWVVFVFCGKLKILI